jgi:hypothetical protein
LLALGVTYNNKAGGGGIKYRGLGKKYNPPGISKEKNNNNNKNNKTKHEFILHSYSGKNMKANKSLFLLKWKYSITNGAEVELN